MNSEQKETQKETSEKWWSEKPKEWLEGYAAGYRAAGGNLSSQEFKEICDHAFMMGVQKPEPTMEGIIRKAEPTLEGTVRKRKPEEEFTLKGKIRKKESGK